MTKVLDIKIFAQQKLIGGKPYWIVFKPGFFLDRKPPFLHSGYVSEIKEFLPIII